MDLLIDRPGERVPSDWIATQLNQWPGTREGLAGRQAVAASLRPVAAPSVRSGRRLPFYWWQGKDNGPSSYGMKPGVAMLFREARRKVGGDRPNSAGRDWGAGEIASVVEDYLGMLQTEIAGEPYSKASHQRALLPRLDPARTAGSVEYKHQNISAAMVDLGLPFIRGYKPMSNYQRALTAEIQWQLEADPQLLLTLRGDEHDGPAERARLQRAPVPPSVPDISPGPRNRTGRHPDYGLLQEENRRRGRQGEELVVGYERDWLRSHGRPDLADAVQWTSDVDGDGIGYDVLSFWLDGRERYIEVKATAYGPGTPFYISSAELDFAQRHEDSYALYRVYDILRDPRFFMLEGGIAEVLTLTSVTYSARIGSSS